MSDINFSTLTRLSTPRMTGTVAAEAVAAATSEAAEAAAAVAAAEMSGGRRRCVAAGDIDSNAAAVGGSIQ